jgi:hypothetical protein
MTSMNEEEEEKTVATPARPDPLIDIGSGVEVPQSELMAQYNPRCIYCTEGWQHYTEGGKERRRICGCAVKGMRRKLAGQAAPTLIGRVVKTPAAQEAARAHAKKELERMRALLLEAEEQLARHIEGHDTGVAEAEAQLAEAVEQQRRTRDDLDFSRTCLSELEGQLVTLRTAIDSRLQVVAEQTEKLRIAGLAADERERERAAIKAKSNAIFAAPVLRQRIERIKTRIALYRQRKADLLGEDDGGVDDFEMEVQRAEG